MSTSELLALSRRLHSAQSLEQVMRETRATVAAATRYDRVWINFLSSDGIGIELVGYVLADEQLVHQLVADLRVDQDPWLQLLFTTKAPFVVEDMRTHPLPDQRQVELFGNRTMILVPMLKLAERVGLMAVGTFADQGVVAPTDEEFEFIIQVASLVSAITGRIDAEKKQAELEKKMRATQRMETLGRLAGEVSHDINNILVCIAGNTELAKMDLNEDHTVHELLDEVLQASSRAAALTRQLLAFSKGQLLQRRKLDVSSVVRDLARMLTRLLPDPIELRLDLSENIQTIMDQGQLEQMVMNLVLNGRDAMEDGGVLTITTQTTSLDSEDDLVKAAGSDRFWRLRVIDEGAGMPPEICDQIFDPFFTTKAVGKGTGLGLSVVDTVLGEYGGRAHVHSVEGEGTTIEVLLPVGQGLENMEPAPGSLSQEGLSARNSERVLIVDDDPFIRLYLERLLSQAGYRIALAENGRQALQRLGEHPETALILSDLMMPVMGGRELLSVLRTRQEAPALLMMTGYAGNEAELQDTHWIAKPFASTLILSKIRELLDASDS